MDAALTWPEFELMSLADKRDALTSGLRSAEMRTVLLGILDGSKYVGPAIPTPLQDLRDLLDTMRNLPPEMERLCAMNTFVRTLGERHNLAKLLDILRQSYLGEGPEAVLASRSQKGRMHCIYGWSGQTILLASNPEPTSVTEVPTDDMDSFLGYPPAEWDMSIHIWQPNPQVVGFRSTRRLEADAIVEPPHSHPFSFASYVSIGSLRESIYCADEVASTSVADDASSYRYAGVTLQQVDGVWPPHESYKPTHLRTNEDRVLLEEGQSYFLSCSAIHDVEVDRSQAAATPAITLFLCAEATMKPSAYLANDMAEYHRQNPFIKDVAVPLSAAEWDAKLVAVVDYLRGDSSQLRLDRVITCNSDYGFMHIKGE